jgi:hypothetical protein
MFKSPTYVILPSAKFAKPYLTLSDKIQWSPKYNAGADALSRNHEPPPNDADGASRPWLVR